MSRATIDRCLKKARFTHRTRSLHDQTGEFAQTGHSNPHLYALEDEHPGFMEIDLVAHCGSSTDGTYLNTLTATDLATGWTECLAVAQKTNWPSLRRLPDASRSALCSAGLDSDNGSEFITTPLSVLLAERYFYPSRPYQRMTRPCRAEELVGSAPYHRI